MKKKFDFDIGMVDEVERHYQVYMHFDFDHYDADKMDDLRLDDMKGKFSVYRMVPQG